ncbi:MAG: hypothetical protein AB8G95_02885 [Anaerolineae bacterium]
MTEFPTFIEFNSLSHAEISSLAPETIVYNTSGSRRSAALAGVEPEGDEYAAWNRIGMINRLKMLFDHGVKHILKPVVTPSMFSEKTENYSEHLWRWIDWAFASEESLAEFTKLGWNVNIIFAEFMPELHKTQQRLSSLGWHDDRPSLWIIVNPKHNQFNEWMLQKIQSQETVVANSQEAIKLLYGADIPPAKLYLDFGKLMISPDIVPPFLKGVMDCYWTQQPGYRLTDENFRRILYDSLYTRKTWKKDKRGRALEAVNTREYWEGNKVVGIGKRLEPYWYPTE